MHIHEWSRLSSHTTSEGLVVYVRCACGVHSVEIVPRAPRQTARTVVTLDGAPVRERGGWQSGS